MTEQERERIREAGRRKAAELPPPTTGTVRRLALIIASAIKESEQDTNGSVA